MYSQLRLLENNDKKVKLILWDTAGQECFQSIVKLYYKIRLWKKH